MGGIAAASSGDEVWVAKGTYLEWITLSDGVALYGGFAGTETDRNKRDARTNATILDQNKAYRVVAVPSGAGVRTVIDGFTIQRGGWAGSTTGGGVYCGPQSKPLISNNVIRWNSTVGTCGIYCDGASPTITGNTITGNSAGYGYGGGVCCTAGSSPVIVANLFSGNGGTYGGAIACQSSSPVISRNKFIGNTAIYGGAICCESSAPSISDNVFIQNSASYGGAVYCTKTSSPVVTGCSFVANTTNGYCGGIYCTMSSSPTIANNTFTAGGGAAIYCSDRSGPAVTNNTIADTSGEAVYVEASCSPALSNNIIAFGRSGVYSLGGSTLRSNCVYNPGGVDYSGVSPGEGDISVDPGLANLRVGDVHIQPDSPCRDTGWNGAPGIGGIDIDGQARVQGGAVDIGADETEWPTTIPVIRVDPANGDDTNDGSSWTSAMKTINAAIGRASERGGEVWAKAGIYHERVNVKTFTYLYGGFAGNETARDERDWAANKTIIEATGSWDVVSIPDPGYNLTSVDGFTIRGGNRGISCGSVARPIIAHCTILGNATTGISCSYSSALILGNTITGNTAAPREGGGIDCYYSSPTIAGNLIAGNQGYGGGIYIDSPSGPTAITNNTIVLNTSNPGGAILCPQSSSVTIANNIMAFNTSGIQARPYSPSGTPTLRNNCVYHPAGQNYDGVAAGEGDISVDPLLSLDYHLAPISPCIDKGWNDAPGLPAFDIDGESRVNGMVDMGADEMWQAVGAAKAAGDADPVALSGVVVTAAFDGFFYVESTDRTCGIRVEKPDHGLSVGARVDVIGTPETDSEGERRIRATSAAVTGTGKIEPLGMTNRDIGGGTFGYQQGVWGWQMVKGEDGKMHRQWMQVGGLSSLGLLVRTSGRVIETGPGWLRIEDGSDIGIRCLLPDGVSVGSGWGYVTVTGILSCERVHGELRGIIRVRGREDVATTAR